MTADAALAQEVLMNNHTPSPRSAMTLRSPDNIDDVLTDACALIARIILLAPPERHRAICDHVQREIGTIVDHVLHDSA